MKIPEFRLERYFARWEFAAPYLLCASDVEGIRMQELLLLADRPTAALWDALTLGYTEAPGHPLLREEIARLYATPQIVYTFAGAQEALFAAMNVLLGPGDHAIAVWPAYQSLHEVARATGASVTLLPLDENRGWALDLDQLKQAIRPDTKVLVVNFPHNPTGALPDKRDWAELVRIAREAGIYLVSDEVYRFLEHDDADRLPAAASGKSSTSGSCPAGAGAVGTGKQGPSSILAGWSLDAWPRWRLSSCCLQRPPRRVAISAERSATSTGSSSPPPAFRAA